MWKLIDTIALFKMRTGQTNSGRLTLYGKDTDSQDHAVGLSPYSHVMGYGVDIKNIYPYV